MRLLLFGLLFLVFLLLTAPLERYALPWLAGPLGRLGVTLEMKTLRVAPPAGVRASDLRLSSENASLALDSLYFDVMRSFSARGCGGASIDGKVTSDSIAFRASGLDPSECLKVGRLTLRGVFDAALAIDHISLLHGAYGDKTEAHVEFRTDGGTFGGFLPGGGDPSAAVPLGEWDFKQARLDASWRGGKLDVKEGSALAEGVRWELLGATLLPDHGGDREVRIDLRARIQDDSPRAKAMIGLMPKATANGDGWRHYRVVGPVHSMKLIGLQ